MSLYTAPVSWSQSAVGTWPRFCFMLVAQSAGFIYFGSRSGGWSSVEPVMFFGLIMPVLYLIALRGLLRELHRRTAGHDQGAHPSTGASAVPPRASA